MPLFWNEIKHRAIKSGNDWKTETREAAERQTFWNEFFDIFWPDKLLRARVEHLFALYEKLTAPPVAMKPRKK